MNSKTVSLVIPATTDHEACPAAISFSPWLLRHRDCGEHARVRRVGGGNTSSTSLRPSLRKPAYGERFARGSCTYAATRRLRVFPVCLTQSSGVGSNTTGD